MVSDRFNVRCLCLHSLSRSHARSLSLSFLCVSVCIGVREQRHTHRSFVKMGALSSGCRLQCETHALPLPLSLAHALARHEHAHNFYMLIMRLLAIFIVVDSECVDGGKRETAWRSKVLFTYALSFYLRLPLTWRAVILLLPLPFLLAHFVIIACVRVYACICM